MNVTNTLARTGLTHVGRRFVGQPFIRRVLFVMSLVLGLYASLFAGQALALTATTTTVTLTTPTVSVGQATTLTATVTPTAATGTVTFKDGTTTLGTATMSAGVAKLSTSFSTIASHPITAVYYGSTVYATSTSASVAQNVAAIATTSTLSASPTTVYVGQTATLSVSVSPSAATGTVTFKDGTTTLGTAILSGGVASVPVSFATAATHPLTVVYTGAGNYAGSTSATVNETVTAVTTTSTSLALTNPTVSVGQATTLTATVTPTAATGTMTFKDGTATIGTVPVSAGVAKLSTNFSTLGAHSLTAVFTGTAAYSGSTSAAQSQNVTTIATTSVLNATPSSVSVGQTATLTVTVSPSAATGTVTFKDGSTTLGTATLSGGTASLAASFATAATHPLTAVYAGAGNYAGSTSAVFNETVTALRSTTTTLAITSSPAFTGTASAAQSLTLTASVSPNTATGVVSFLDGSTTLGTANITSGVAKFVTSFATTGLHSVKASYAGLAPFAGSISAVTSVGITSTTTTKLTASTLSTTAGQTITLTVNMTPSSATGSVTFKDGSTTLGTGNLSAGVATLNKAFTTQGLHLLNASYAGDGYAQASNSAVLNLAVNGAPAVIPPAPSASAPVVSLAYDAQGNATSITKAPDSLALVTNLTYDPLRRPSTVTDAASGNTQLSYDGQDNLTQVTDPKGLATQYPRDGLGQATQLISPDTGTANLTYDAAGNLLTRTDSRGVLAQYSYDALNRLTNATLSKSGQPNQAYTWVYDQNPGQGSSFNTYGIGRLTSITFPEGNTAYAYDAQGRVTGMRQTLTGNAAANTLTAVQYLSFAYDGAGNRTSVTYPSGRVLSIAYANGLATGMSLGGTPLISNLQFAPFGGPKSWNWVMNSGVNGGSNGGLVPHSRTFDTSGRLTRYPLGEHLRDVSYDAANRITGYTHYVAASGATTGAPAPAQDQQFSYDSLDRLTQATTALASWTYTYDANGNRTSVAVNNGNSTATNSYTVDPASNRLTNLGTPAVTLTHDAMGNIVSDGTYTLGYDLRGRLSTAAQGGYTTTYAYDNAGQRVRKYNNTGPGSTQLYVYDLKGQLLGEYDGTGNAIREYVWLDNLPIAMITPDPAMGANANTAAPLIYYIHADHLNTPRVLVDKTNTMRWRWMSEPFGTSAPETSPAGLADLKFNLRFPGQFYDAESGMMYNYQRDYIPGIGRYAQSDPIGLEGGQFSTYSYVNGNPLSYVDPLGLATGDNDFGIKDPGFWKWWEQNKRDYGPFDRSHDGFNPKKPFDLPNRQMADVMKDEYDQCKTRDNGRGSRVRLPKAPRGGPGRGLE